MINVGTQEHSTLVPHRFCMTSFQSYPIINFRNTSWRHATLVFLDCVFMSSVVTALNIKTLMKAKLNGLQLKETKFPLLLIFKWTLCFLYILIFMMKKFQWQGVFLYIFLIFVYMLQNNRINNEKYLSKCNQRISI